MRKQDSLLGHAWGATAGNGSGNFRAGILYWDTLEGQREAMDLVTFGLGFSIGTRLGGQREAMDLVSFELGTTTATRLGGNGTQWIS